MKYAQVLFSNWQAQHQLSKLGLAPSLDIAPEAQENKGLDVPTDFKEFTKLLRIRSGSEIKPFELYDWQEELSRIADDCRGMVVFKVRQVGATEALAAKMLHKACLYPAYSGTVFSLGGKETSKVAKRVRRMPSQIRDFSFATNAVTELSIAGGGTLGFLPATDNACRSLESVWDELFDEAAFVQNIEEIYSSATPAQEALGDRARTWVVSTMSPLGKLSWFWEMLSTNNGDIDLDRAISRAQEGIEPFQYWVDSTGWAKVIVHWKAHPIYSQIPDYLAKTKREKRLTEEKLQREYNLGIPETGGLLFKANLIPLLATGTWKEAESGKKYLAGIDPNFGSDDYFCLQIWEISKKPYELVRQYRKSKTSNTYNLLMAVALLQQYRPIITAVEDNSGGAVVMENLINRCPGLRIEKVTTTSKSKEINTDRLAYLIENQEIIYPPDWEACCKHKDEAGDLMDGEFYQFSALERKGLKGHDDSIMAAAATFAWLEEALK